MAELLFELSGNADALENGFHLQMGLGRMVVLWARYSATATDENLRHRDLKLVFDGTESFKVSYKHAVNVDIVWNASNKVVEVGRTEYLTETEMHLRLNGDESNGLRHLVFFPENGPSYEFICREFNVYVDSERQ